MNEQEKIALQKIHLALINDLDAKEVSPHLFQNDMLTCEEYEEIDELNETRREKCKRLLRFLTRPKSKCTFEGFIESLRYNDAYFFLADKLEATLKEVLQAGTVTATRTANQNEISQPSDQQNSPITERSDVLYEPVSKINVFTKKRRAMSALAHKLKRLSHNGDYESFQTIVQTIDSKYQRYKLSGTKKIGDRMELADMRFTSLEAKVGSKRVQYDKSLNDGDVFRHMESVIPFTSNPRVSSMTYLARYGSAVAMKKSIDEGLAYVQYAKEHAEYVTPCKDTGMVYYIEVNLLSQKYETNPNDTLKRNILRTSEQGIAQFNREDDEIRKDYQRMLLLKMVYCYLGVGLFCKKIEDASTTNEDREEAKKVIDFIETRDVWQGMEKRRKMLFYVAKSEYYKQQGIMDQAMVYAKQAEKLGKKNNWKAEYPNICKMLSELKTSRSSKLSKVESQSAKDIIAELFEDFPENEDDLHGENLEASALNSDTELWNEGVSDQCSQAVQESETKNTRMKNLDEEYSQNGIETSSSFGNNDRMMLLKETKQQFETRSLKVDKMYQMDPALTSEIAQNSYHHSLYTGAKRDLDYMLPLKTENCDSVNANAEGTEMKHLKCPFGEQCTQESPPQCTDQSSFHNQQCLMLLKDQNVADNTPSCAKLTLPLLKGCNQMRVQLHKNSNTSLPSKCGRLPTPLL